MERNNYSRRENSNRSRSRSNNSYWERDKYRNNFDEYDYHPQTRNVSHDPYNDTQDYSFGRYSDPRDENYERPYSRYGNDEMNEGYAGRNSNDYRNDYGGSRYYDPSDYERGGYRREEDNGNRNYNENREYENRYDRNNQGRYNYDYYESYPSYGQSAPYSDHELGLTRRRNERERESYPGRIYNKDRY
jgi:hypothetical protein